MKILIINGPNLNKLGQREPEHYGCSTLDQIIKMTEKKVADLDNQISLDWRQSNSEGEIVEWIQKAEGLYDAVVINPGGYSHSSVAILDALLLYTGNKIEVHFSKISGRDEFRQRLITAQGVDILLEGLLDLSYFIAVYTIYAKKN